MLHKLFVVTTGFSLHHDLVTTILIRILPLRQHWCHLCGDIHSQQEADTVCFWSLVNGNLSMDWGAAMWCPLFSCLMVLKYLWALLTAPFVSWVWYWILAYHGTLHTHTPQCHRYSQANYIIVMINLYIYFYIFFFLSKVLRKNDWSFELWQIWQFVVFAFISHSTPSTVNVRPLGHCPDLLMGRVRSKEKRIPE